MAEVTYYFNAYTTPVWVNPDNLVDGNTGTFAASGAKTEQVLTGNTCPGTDLGGIAKVELRLYGYGDGDDRIDITPVFAGGNGDTHPTTPVVSPGGWTAYVDITSDTNAPDWSLWSHIQTLDCIIDNVPVAKGNTLYCAKVEIRVTIPVSPTVTTQAVSNIAPFTATGNGNITDNGGQDCSKRGVCWNTTGNPTVADDKSEETDSFGTGAFSRSMTGLASGQHYYVKAYAYNSAGYGYGNQVEFDTPSGDYLISTAEIASVTAYDTQRKLVRLSDGTLYAVFFKRLAGMDQIYVKKSIDNGENWGGETRISVEGGYNQRFPSIAVDSSNHLHVVWRGASSEYATQIWYAKYTDSWTPPVRISTYAGMGSYPQFQPSITVDSSNYLHVVWRGDAPEHPTATQIWYAKYTDSWVTPIRISTYSGMGSLTQWHVSIAVDSSSHLHVVWAGRATGYTTAEQIWYAKYTDSWSAPLRISTYSGMESYNQARPSIAVDSSNSVHVVWYGMATGYTTAEQIWYIKYTDSWSAPLRISTYSEMESYAQVHPSIAIDSSNSVHVVWAGRATGYTDYDKVWYGIYTASWTAPECLQATGQNKYPNLRWSRYPSSNIPSTRVDYVFTEGTASLYDIYFGYKDIEAPPEGVPQQAMHLMRMSRQ